MKKFETKNNSFRKEKLIKVVQTLNDFDLENKGVKQAMKKLTQENKIKKLSKKTIKPSKGSDNFDLLKISEKEKVENKIVEIEGLDYILNPFNKIDFSNVEYENNVEIIHNAKSIIVNADRYENVYFVGDLHGQIEELHQKLIALNFNKEKDLLVCTGDLIDRGKTLEDNIACLKLLKEKWFLSTLGNHEEMAYLAVFKAQMTEVWYRNGGEWFYDLKNCFNEAGQRINPTLNLLCTELKEKIVKEELSVFNTDKKENVLKTSNSKHFDYTKFLESSDSESDSTLNTDKEERVNLTKIKINAFENEFIENIKEKYKDIANNRYFELFIEVHQLLGSINNMPLIIEVHKNNKKVIVVHADYPFGFYHDLKNSDVVKIERDYRKLYLDYSLSLLNANRYLFILENIVGLSELEREQFNDNLIMFDKLNTQEAKESFKLKKDFDPFSYFKLDSIEPIFKDKKTVTLEEEVLIWSRERFDDEHKLKEIVVNVDLVVHGHTPLEKPLLTGNKYYIDTGAFLSKGYLTVLNLKEMLKEKDFLFQQNINHYLG